MKALVTGGGGFLGRYIVEQLLDRGDQVTSFSRSRYPELEQSGAQTTQGDLQDADALRQACHEVDTVFHVAAQAGLWGTWESFYNTNVVGTQNVIEACQAQGVERLIYTSSPSVIFDNTPQEGCDESLPYPAKYESFYPHTKAIAERMVKKANGQRELLTVCLRPHLIWGPRDNHILPQLIARAKKGRVPQVGDGTNKADLTYVKDAARAHLLAADALQPGSRAAGSPAAGAVYFISQDAPVNMWRWINDLLARLDISPIKQRLSLKLARAAGAVLEGLYRILPLKGEPRMTRFLASELAMSHYYDISRAKRDLGYSPQYTMDQALEETIDYLKTQGF